MSVLSPPRVGIIANPVSARDIRRITANASNLQTSDRASIILRMLAVFRRMGIPRVWMMPERAGLAAYIGRRLHPQRSDANEFAGVDWLDFRPEGTVEDTFTATRMMRGAGASALVVLGGDGTHRAVVRECGAVPIAGLSTGTNNAFPEMRESTLTAMAVALTATGRISAQQALSANKLIEVHITDAHGGRARRDIAIVDAVISRERLVGARALWRPDSLAAAYLTYADPECIGLSAIGGLLQPVGRQDRGGLAVHLCALDAPQMTQQLLAPIAPGLLSRLGIAHWHRLEPDTPCPVGLDAGIVALDGEREMAFAPGDRVSITLRENAFSTVDVGRCLRWAAQQGLFLGPH